MFQHKIIILKYVFPSSVQLRTSLEVVEKTWFHHIPTNKLVNNNITDHIWTMGFQAFCTCVLSLLPLIKFNHFQGQFFYDSKWKSDYQEAVVAKGWTSQNKIHSSLESALKLIFWSWFSLAFFHHIFQRLFIMSTLQKGRTGCFRELKELTLTVVAFIIWSKHTGQIYKMWNISNTHFSFFQ